MLTYGEIATQVVRRLGKTGYEGIAKSDLSYAIHQSELDLLGNVEPARLTKVLHVTSDKGEYPLKEKDIEDFSSPEEILVYDNSDTRLDHIEVTYDKWLRYNPSLTATNENDVVGLALVSLPDSIEAMNLTNKVVVAIHFDAGESGDESDYILHIKPAINGKIILMYNVTANDDVFSKMKQYPRLPGQHHHWIVPGAVWYMAQQEASRAMDAQDLPRVQFFVNIRDKAKADFDEGKKTVTTLKDAMTKPVVANPYIWFEDPRKSR